MAKAPSKSKPKKPAGGPAQVTKPKTKKMKKGIAGLGPDTGSVQDPGLKKSGY